MLAQWITLPIETIQRMQASHDLSVRQLVRRVYAEGGILGFWANAGALEQRRRGPALTTRALPPPSRIMLLYAACCALRALPSLLPSASSCSTPPWSRVRSLVMGGRQGC